MTSDDRGSVNSNIESLGAHGALRWAIRGLGSGRLPSVHKQRMLVLTIRETSKIIRVDLHRGRTLMSTIRNRLTG